MKKIISFLLALFLLIQSFPIITFAQEMDEVYTMDQIEYIQSNYKKQENMLNLLLCNENNVCYWSMVNDTEGDKTKQWLLENASKLIKEYPDNKDYVEILTSLMTMQSGKLAQQIEAQSQFDDLHEGVDYVLDVVEIASSFIGGSGLLESISPIIDAGTEGIDVVVENVEQAKYYELIIQDYSQSYNFLNAIYQYAENKELRNVAGSLLSANDSLLQKRLEYLGNTLENIGVYEADFFVKNMFYDILKETDTYKEDDTVKWFVDGGENWQNLWLTTKEQQGFVFKTMMLIGNVGFGTNNTFNRYQEMRVLSQIAEALTEANSKVKVLADYEDEDTMENIQMKCSYYKSLIVTHARGEYLAYQLLVNDAGLLSQFRVLFDIFKEPEDTVEGWYNKRTEVLTRYAGILDDLFVISDECDIGYHELTIEEWELLEQQAWALALVAKGKDTQGTLSSRTGLNEFYIWMNKVLPVSKVNIVSKDPRNYIDVLGEETGVYEILLKDYVWFYNHVFNIDYKEEDNIETDDMAEWFQYSENGKVYYLDTYWRGESWQLEIDKIDRYFYLDDGTVYVEISLYDPDEPWNTMNLYVIGTILEKERNKYWSFYDISLSPLTEKEEYVDILDNASVTTEEQINISSVSEQDICNAMRTAGKFAWDWFWDSSREVVDESDTYMELIIEDYAQEYKCVSYEGIKNIEDVLELTKHYFTEDIAETLIEQKLWYESGTFLYMSEPDGIGAFDPDYYDIEILKESDTAYSIMVYEYLGGELVEEPYEIHYMYINGYWVFDEILCMCDSSTPINVKWL